jgi:pimeloyl-ACP methyl ester carboxylesterase
MATAHVNGVDLYYERLGAGEPLVLVHGSWGDHDNWAPVVPKLAELFDVVTYDRRGHSQSERPPGPGSRREDAADLGGLIEQLELAPAHVAGNSFGASIVLALAIERPDLFRTLLAHEPPLFALLADDPEWAEGLSDLRQRIEGVAARLEAGEAEEGARRFVDEVAFGPGAWESMPAGLRQTFIRNAPTFLDEGKDPGWNDLDLGLLAIFPGPALLTEGDQSPPYFPPIVRKLGATIPRAESRVIEGAGHVPHATLPDRYVELVKEACLGSATRPA